VAIDHILQAAQRRQPVRVRVTRPPPKVDAEGSLRHTSDGGFEVEFRKVDRRALEQIKSYAAFVRNEYPDWLVRLQLDAAPQTEPTTLRMLVFPSRMALHYYLGGHGWRRR
jgi:hypothetical protein